MDERRKYPRLAIDVNVNWKKVESKGPKTSKKELTRNISEGGVCMVVDEPVRKGDIIELDLELPNSRIIHANGRVAWASEFDIIGGKVEQKYDIGIEFIGLSDADRQEIKKFVFKLMNEG
ncbi:MAG TPA: PilZ domain-containing protein [Candidatus Omnitrophota bacterium]|nr:PilZ domain-containing protein [Candidatus Omnitrophota bacterium]